MIDFLITIFALSGVILWVAIVSMIVLIYLENK
jgi:hypothetical protein